MHQLQGFPQNNRHRTKLNPLRHLQECRDNLHHCLPIYRNAVRLHYTYGLTINQCTSMTYAHRRHYHGPSRTVFLTRHFNFSLYRVYFNQHWMIYTSLTEKGNHWYSPTRKWQIDMEKEFEQRVGTTCAREQQWGPPNGHNWFCHTTRRTLRQRHHICGFCPGLLST